MKGSSRKVLNILKVMLLLRISLEMTHSEVWMILYDVCIFDCSSLFLLSFSSAVVPRPPKVINLCMYLLQQWIFNDLSFFPSHLFSIKWCRVSACCSGLLSYASLTRILSDHFCADHFHLWCIISCFAFHYGSPLQSLPGHPISNLGRMYKIRLMTRCFAFFYNSFHCSALSPKNDELAA